MELTYLKVHESGGRGAERGGTYPGTPVTDLGSERQAAARGRAHQHWLLPARKQQAFLLLASLWSLVIALGDRVDTVLISKASPGRFCCLRPWTREEEEQTLLWEGEKHLALTGKKSYLHSLPFLSLIEFSRILLGYRQLFAVTVSITRWLFTLSRKQVLLLRRKVKRNLSHSLWSLTIPHMDRHEHQCLRWIVLSVLNWLLLWNFVSVIRASALIIWLHLKKNNKKKPLELV